jgi:hypothetical protein
MKHVVLTLAALIACMLSNVWAAESIDAQFEKAVLDHQLKSGMEAPVFLSFGIPDTLLRWAHLYQHGKTGIRARVFPSISDEIFGMGPLVIREFHVLDFSALKPGEDVIRLGQNVRHHAISFVMKATDDEKRDFRPVFIVATRGDSPSAFETLDEFRLLMHPNLWPKTLRGAHSKMAEIALREGRTAKHFLGSNVLRVGLDDFPLESFSIEFSRPILSAVEANWPAAPGVVTSTIFQIDRHYNSAGLLTEVTGGLSRAYRNQPHFAYNLSASEFSLLGFTQLRHLAVDLAFEPVALSRPIAGQPTGRFNNPHWCREFIGSLFDAEGPKPLMKD